MRFGGNLTTAGRTHLAASRLASEQAGMPDGKRTFCQINIHRAWNTGCVQSTHGSRRMQAELIQAHGDGRVLVTVHEHAIPLVWAAGSVPLKQSDLRCIAMHFQLTSHRSPKAPFPLIPQWPMPGRLQKSIVSVNEWMLLFCNNYLACAS